jgi:hypothetical protein
VWTALRDILLRRAWVPVLVFAANAVLSLVFHAYEAFPLLDVPMHLIGGAAIAYFLWHTVAAFEKGRSRAKQSRAKRSAAVFLLALAAALLWELAEFGSDRILGTTAFGATGDTVLDVLLGMAGAAAYLLYREKGRENA